jgi:FkbM family methyltransferase
VFVAQEYKMPYQVDPQVTIDAGANIGMATLFFSHDYPRAKLFAIEPEASNFTILKKNCVGLPNVVFINAALWPTEQALVIKDLTVKNGRFPLLSEKTHPIHSR